MSVDPRGAAAPRPEPQGAGVRAAAAKAIRAVRFDGVSLKAVLPKALAGISQTSTSIGPPAPPFLPSRIRPGRGGLKSVSANRR